jgi:predicted nucleic acid-binding protein
LEGAAFEILKAWQEQRFRLAIAPPILDEYRRVLDEIMKNVLSQCSPRSLESSSFPEMVEPVSFAEPVCGDPDDDKFVEAALAAHAGYVVSGDAALLNVKHHHGIEIVRSSDTISRFSLSLILRQP